MGTDSQHGNTSSGRGRPWGVLAGGGRSGVAYDSPAVGPPQAQCRCSSWRYKTVSFRIGIVAAGIVPVHAEEADRETFANKALLDCHGLGHNRQNIGIGWLFNVI